MRLLGAIFTVCGAGAWGIIGVLRLKKRENTLLELTRTLAVLRSDIGTLLTPLPELLLRISSEARAPASSFYHRVYTGLGALGETTFSGVWSSALRASAELGLSEDEYTALEDLGRQLGKYDSEQQQVAIAYAERRFEEFSRRASVRRERESKVRAAMGLCGGVFAVLLLI